MLLLQSIYSGRPNTIYFQYPESCKQEIPPEIKKRILDPEIVNLAKIYKYKMKYSSKKANGLVPKCIQEVLLTAGAKTTSSPTS